MGWSISPQEAGVEISVGGKVTFPPNTGNDKEWTIRYESQDGKHCGEQTFIQKGNGGGGGDYGVDNDTFMYIKVVGSTNPFHYHFRIALDDENHEYVDFVRIQSDNKLDCNHNEIVSSEYFIDKQLIAFDNNFGNAEDDNHITNLEKYGNLYKSGNCVGNNCPLYPIYSGLINMKCVSLESYNDKELNEGEYTALKRGILGMLSSCRGLNIANSGHKVYYYDASGREQYYNASITAIQKWNADSGYVISSFDDNKFRNGNSRTEGVLYTFTIIQ